MTSFNRFERTKRPNLPRRIVMLLLVLILLTAAGLVAVHHIYNQGLKPVSSVQATTVVTVEKGSSSKDIAKLLADKHLIRSAWAFELYIHSKNLGDKLQAGTYALSPDQTTPQIIALMTKGAVTTNLVTILPGRRIDQVRADLINAGFAPTAVDQALQPDQYSDVPVLAYKPAGASLEGLLYPDSFQRTGDTDPSVIIRESLQEMSDHLTTDLQATFAAQGLTTYQGLVLASMLEKEVSKPSDRAQAAQVFLKRLKTGMSLGSDVTAIYGAINAGKTNLSQAAMLTYDSPYNTLMHTGLPPAPISTVSDSSLQAAGHPASTDWLYFVSGDDGNTYFATNLQDHQANTAKYCHKLCGQ
ncbi:MAG TPA: endolytic transglycosylase MltG [Candidatus Microsaccharimonas sp.]|nr:endolytic transglycosylase MltG [Candidatus Microsaccharimonas sp.]